MTEILDRNLDARQLLLPEMIAEFIFSGNAIFTIVSNETGRRFTFKVTKGDKKPGDESTVWWCKLLTGADNQNDYRYFGFFKQWKKNGIIHYYHGKPDKACAARSAASVKGFLYVVGNVMKGFLPHDIQFWHEGHCGRCARPLTNPESIERGYGPECIQHVGG